MLLSYNFRAKENKLSILNDILKCKGETSIFLLNVEQISTRSARRARMKKKCT
jgi:hypothetical protein